MRRAPGIKGNSVGSFHFLFELSVCGFFRRWTGYGFQAGGSMAAGAGTPRHRNRQPPRCHRTAPCASSWRPNVGRGAPAGEKPRGGLQLTPRLSILTPIQGLCSLFPQGPPSAPPPVSRGVTPRKRALLFIHSVMDRCHIAFKMWNQTDKKKGTSPVTDKGSENRALNMKQTLLVPGEAREGRRHPKSALRTWHLKPALEDSALGLRRTEA